MSQEQINIILEQLKEIRAELASMRKENSEDHKALVERVVKLESSTNFIKKACWTVGAAILIMLSKQMFMILGG